MFFVPTRATHKTEPAGVSFDSFKIMTKQFKNKLNINYIDFDEEKPVLRSEAQRFYIESDRKPRVLYRIK